MEKLCGRGSKSVKIDRISELPEELLIHILSFLSPKFAYTTSVVSKRWKPLCQFLTVLRFDDKSVKNQEEFISFNMFIDKVMLSKDRQQQPIKVFHLRCHSAHSLINHDEWIEAAKRRGIEDLQLSMFQFIMVRRMYVSCSNSMMDNFITISPNNVFTCRTLVILKLKRLCVVSNILSIDLPSLKILHLKGVCLQNSEDLKGLVSASSVLQDLYILVGYKLQIPLTRLGLGPYHVLFKAIYYSVQFLRLEVRLPNENILSYFKGSPVFRNLIHIELLFYHLYGWDDVVNVLHHCPNLHIFSIDRAARILSKDWFRKWETTLPFDGKLFTNWKSPNSVPKCISSHLTACTVTYDGHMDSLRFAEYILQNARLLQVMTVKITNLSNTIHDWVFLDKLCSCPKISPICEISIVQI